MKKILLILLCIIMSVSFSACGERGQYYESVSDMQEAVCGIWTTSEQWLQLNVSAETVTVTYRDASYEDHITEYPSISWDHEKGRITLGDTNEYILVEQGGGALINNETRYFAGGELAKKPIPKEILYNTVMRQVYQYAIWSADMGTLCRQVTRNTVAEYYYFDDFIDTFDLTEPLIEKEAEYEGDAYFVTLTGDVSQNATMANFYHPTAHFATYLIILNGSTVEYIECCFMSGTFSTAALTYFSSGY